MAKKSVGLCGALLAVALAALLAGCGLFGGDTDEAGGGGTSDGAGGPRTDAAEVNEPYEAAPQDVTTDPDTGVSYVSGVLLVYFDPSASEQARDAAVALVDGEVIGRMDAFDELQLRVEATDTAELEALCDQLEAAEGVDVVSLDYVAATGADLVPDDPWGGSGMTSTDNAWWSWAVDGPLAWDYLAQAATTPVDVAVVDNGFDMGHEDLSGRLAWASSADASRRNARDHGSHVAGIMGAVADNGRGITGMTWQGQVLCLDASTGTGNEHDDRLPDSALEQGLLEAVNAGARVINFSNGGSRSFAADEWPQHEDLVASAGRLYSRRMGALLAAGHDFVVVQAAGNGDASGRGVDARYNLEFASITAENCDRSYASAEDILGRIIIVAAVQREGSGYRLTDFSNGGGQVSVCAPGFEVYSTVVGGYRAMSGTSMAAPIAAGTAALVWEANPGLSGREVKQLVCDGGGTYVPAPAGARYGAGSCPMVNAGAAVADALALAGQEPVVGADTSTARACFGRFLRNIYDTGTPGAGTVSLPGEGSDTDTYQHFMVGDFDGDGDEELYLAHEVTGEFGNSFGCLNDVYEYDAASDEVVYAWRAITAIVPTEVSFFGTGYLRLDMGAGDDVRTYMPVGASYATGYVEIPEGEYLSLEQLGGSWHLLTCSAFAVDGDYEIDEVERNRLVGVYEGSGAQAGTSGSMDAADIAVLG